MDVVERMKRVMVQHHQVITTAVSLSTDHMSVVHRQEVVMGPLWSEGKYVKVMVMKMMQWMVMEE